MAARSTRWQLSILFVLMIIALAPMCDNGSDDSESGKSAGDNVPIQWESGCTENADLICTTYYKCTGILVQDCANAICSEFNSSTLDCILNTTDCAEIRDCLPEQGDDGWFTDDDDDDDDDVVDDDDDVVDDDDDDDDDDTELLSNGYFDDGPVVWTEQSAQGFDIIVDELNSDVDADTPLYLAWLGGYDNADDIIRQPVTIPATATTANMSCYIQIITNETGSAADYVYFTLRDLNDNELISLGSMNNTQPFSQWSSVNFNADVSSYAGQTLRFQIQATTDSADLTNFFLDTCSLTAQ